MIGHAVHVMQIATGEMEDTEATPESEGKDPHAAALGQTGGKARASKLLKKGRKEIARKAARARWSKRKE